MQYVLLLLKLEKVKNEIEVDHVEKLLTYFKALRMFNLHLVGT